MCKPLSTPWSAIYTQSPNIRRIFSVSTKRLRTLTPKFNPTLNAQNKPLIHTHTHTRKDDPHVEQAWVHNYPTFGATCVALWEPVFQSPVSKLSRHPNIFQLTRLRWQRPPFLQYPCPHSAWSTHIKFANFIILAFFLAFWDARWVLKEGLLRVESSSSVQYMFITVAVSSDELRLVKSALSLSLVLTPIWRNVRVIMLWRLKLIGLASICNAGRQEVNELVDLSLIRLHCPFRPPPLT